VLESPPLGDWLAGRLEARGVPLAGRVRVRLELEVLDQASGRRPSRRIRLTSRSEAMEIRCPAHRANLRWAGLTVVARGRVFGS
jgi:hypothetical protein